MADTTHSASSRNEEGVYIPKAYQFERDMDSEEPETRKDHIDFPDEAYDPFVYSSAKELTETDDGLKGLTDMIQSFFNAKRDRIDTLKDYSRGRNRAIRSGRRRMEEYKADYRLAHNWGGYISGFATSHVISNPVTITSANKYDAQLEVVEQINQYNDTKNLDYELAYDASVYGVGYEYHYRDENHKDRMVIIPIDELFVIYDTTVTREIIAAVHVPEIGQKIYPTVYTDTKIIEFKATDKNNPGLNKEKEKTHDYGLVPVVEWKNNRFMAGDFEDVIHLIDAYDASQSDTANYMSDLNDALLVISGDLKAADITPADAMMMKQANLLLLESGLDINARQTNSTAEYIYKQYDVQGTESYKNRLINDIYKISNIPNIDDEKFGSNQSGVAMQYKLLGLTQLRTTKQSFFSKALDRRYQLIENIHKSLSDDKINSRDLTYTFHPNLPEDVWEEVTKYINAGGELSQETLTELANFTDFAQESERMEQERKREAELNEKTMPQRFPLEEEG